jgi:spermidine/putrescine transport system substrate-binding protein
MSRSARPPLSPEASAVVRALSSAGRLSGGRLSRRGLLSGAGALGVGAALAACGTKAPGSSRSSGAAVKPSPAADVSATDKRVAWANWTLYLDKDDETKKYPTLEDFRSKTGITPSYFEEVEDNDSYYGKVQAQLRQGQDIGRDVVVLTDWMTGRLVNAGWVQKLDKAKNIPNAANLLDPLKNVDYDPGRNYSLTWQSGYTGIAYHKDRLKTATKGKKTELKSVDDLWIPDLKGRVSVLTEMRDTIGLIMLSQGSDPSKPFGQDAFDKAMRVLEDQIGSGQIRQVKGNSYKEDLTSGDAIAVIGWSGDIFQLNAEATADDDKAKPPFEFRFPESGGMLWSDNLMVPIGATHKANAEILMNYYYEPEVAAEVANYVNYVCPIKGAKEALLRLPDTDKALANSPFIFPTDDYLSKVKSFRTLTATEEKEFVRSFQNVLGS